MTDRPDVAKNLVDVPARAAVSAAGWGDASVEQADFSTDAAGAHAAAPTSFVG